MDVVVGTYNQVLFGFQLTTNPGSNDSEEFWEFTPKFTDKGHTGCIKSVAIGGKYLASGSTDETIRLFDLKKQVELGQLIEQSGTLTCLEFFNASNLLSASEDGTVCIWECKTWECLKTLKGHRGPVYSVSVHPSGRLALSVSKDKTVRTWNLLTGRSAYVTNIKKVAEIVRWSPSGNVYAVASGSEVSIFKLSETILVISGESGEVVFFDVQEEKTLGRFKAHDIRVKGLAVAHNAEQETQTILFTVASDGSLKSWLLNAENLSEKPPLLAEITIPGRPTCIAVRQPPSKLKEKSREVGQAEEKAAVDAEASATVGTESEETAKIKKRKDGSKKKSKKRKRIASLGSNG